MTVLLALCSLLLIIATTAVGITLGRMQVMGENLSLGPISFLDGVWALLWAIGVPFALSLWSKRGDLSAAAATMSWMPILSNGLGLALAVTTAPSLVGQALQRSDTLVAQATGEDSSLTQAASAVAQESARLMGSPPPAEPFHLSQEIGQDRERTQNISLDVSGNGVFVDLELFGPSGSMKSTYLFDTGASYTTITRDQARRLGIHVPEHAPSLEFNTAAGLRKSPMVYLPKLRIGKVTIEGLLVSVCDSCATARYPGLLGINVMREFHVALDYQARHMQLTPRIYDGPANRAYDIEPTLSMKIVGRPEVWMRNIRWTASVQNRSSRTVRNVVLRARFGPKIEVLSQPIAELKPGEVKNTPIRGRLKKRLPKAAEFTLSLASAQW